MRIVDISQGWHVGMPRFDAAWYPEFNIDRVMAPATDPAGMERTFSHLHLFPHNGSHVESSLHFFPGRTAIDAVGLDHFVGPVSVADLSHLGDLQPVTAEELEKAVGDRWETGMRLLIRTDHPLRHLGDDDYWDTPPYIEESAALWIVDHGAALVGMDCITERPGDRDFPIHRKLLDNEIPILENLANLHDIREPRALLVAAPIKVGDVEAAPVRALVIEGVPC